MPQRSMGITAIGYGLMGVYLLWLGLYLVTLVMSFVNPASVLQWPLFVEKYQSIKSIQKESLIIWLLYLPQLIGLLGVLRLKEWARQLLIVTNAVASFYNVIQPLLLGTTDIFCLMLIVFHGMVILFFMRPSIQRQFPLLDLNGPRLLVIDDDRGFLNMVKTMLNAKGFDVLMALTGEEGLKLAQRRKPALIILDVILPKMKGREVCRRLKENPLTAHIPVIFLTAKNSPDDIRAELEAGGLEHLNKPLDFHQLLEALNRILPHSKV